MSDTTVYKIQADASGAVQAFDKLAEAEDRAAAGASRMGDVIGTAIGFTLGSALTAAGSAVASFIGNIDDFISHGAAVDDVSAAFQTLAEKAGGTADVFLSQLNEATGETIDNFTLMKEANEALRTGMKPDEYIELTKAARALSEETGQGLTESMNELSNAFETGRVMGLKNRLGVIDIAKAEDELAKSLGTTREQLSKEGQVHAARTAILDAAKRKTAEFGTITNDAGDNIERMARFVTEAKNKFAEALSKNDALNKAIERFGTLIKNTDFTPIINGLVKITEYAIGAAGAFVKLARGIVNGAIGKSVDDLFDLATGNQSLEQFYKNITNANKGVGQLSKTLDGGKSSFKAINGEISDLSDWMKQAGSATKDNEEDLINHEKAAEAARKKAEELKEAIKRLNAAVDDSTNQDNFPALTAALENTFSARYVLAPKVLADNIREIARAAFDAGTPIDEITKRLTSIPAEMEKAREEAARASNKGAKEGASGILDFFFDFNDSELEQKIGQIESAFVNAIASIGDSMLKGVALHGDDWANVSGSIASSVANAFIPGSGPLADLGIKAIFSMFGGEDAGTTARKEADRFFADAFDANRLIVVIDGEMKKIKDLVFSNGGSFGSGEADDPFNFFKSLPADAQAAFGGVGAAFEQLLGMTDVISGQIGAVFANNVGGSLQNLQVLVMATGKSFEDLEAAVVAAFMNGDLSAAQAASSLAGIQKLAQKGIPDALGATADAFQNMMDAGTKGGRFTVDSMRDIASEAKELGIKTLPELQAQLVASGRFTADSVAAFFETLDKYGVTTIQGLEDVADQAAIHILGTLETQNFPFSETQKKIDDISAAIEKIPETVSRNLIFKMRVDGSAEDKRIVQTARIEVPGGQGIQ